jgi:hypothetical protein
LRYEGGWTSFEKARDEGRPLPDPEFIARLPGSPVPPRAEKKAQAAAPRRAAAAKAAPEPPKPTRRTASKVRKVEGVRALEARITAMELQLSQMAKRLEDVAQAGNFMETRQLGTEHAELERSLKALYDEWQRSAEPTEGQP